MRTQHRKLELRKKVWQVTVSEFNILDIKLSLPVCLCVSLPLDSPRGRSHPHGLVPAAHWSSLCNAVCTGASGPCRHAAWPQAWGAHWQGVWRDWTVLETCDRRMKGPECLTLSLCIHVCVIDGCYIHTNNSISVVSWVGSSKLFCQWTKFLDCSQFFFTLYFKPTHSIPQK